MLLNTSAYIEHKDLGVLKAANDAMHILALQTPPCFILALTYACWSEDVFEAVGSLAVPSARVLVASCASATALNIFGMSVIRDLGGSLMAIVGKLNTVIVMASSMM